MGNLTEEMNKKNELKVPALPILIMVAIVVVVTNILTFFITVKVLRLNNQKDIVKTVPSPVLSLPTPTNSVSTRVVPKANAKIFEASFVEGNNANEMFGVEQNVQVAPEKGYLLVSSILSHDGGRIVYTEVSECAREFLPCLNDSFEHPTGTSCTICDLNFKVIIKNLQTNEEKTIYELKKSNVMELIVPPARASARYTLVNFPIAWTKNDKDIIGIDGTLVPAQTERPSLKYLVYSTEKNNWSELGSAEDILFYDNFAWMLLLDSNGKQLANCSPLAGLVGNRIKMVNVERDLYRVIYSENIPYISLGNVVSAGGQNSLIYYIRKVEKEYLADNCVEINWSDKGEEKKLVLPNADSFDVDTTKFGKF